MRASIARLTGDSPITPEELEKMRRDAWLREGVFCVRLAEIADDWTRLVIVTEAERRYGKRQERRQ